MHVEKLNEVSKMGNSYTLEVRDEDDDDVGEEEEEEGDDGDDVFTR